MSAIPAGGGRPDRRPDWLARKHGRGTHLDDRARARQQVLDDAVRRAFAADTPRRTGYRSGPFPSREAADRLRRDLYNTGKRLVRRGEPHLGWRVPHRPGPGKCEHCDGWPDGAKCRPSPPGGYFVHYRAFTKAGARAYMVQRYGPDSTRWPFDIMASGPYRPPGPEPASGGPAPGRRPGGTTRPAPDPPPARVRRFGISQPSDTDKPGQPRDTKARRGQPPQEGILDRLRRTLG